VLGQPQKHTDIGCLHPILKKMNKMLTEVQEKFFEEKNRSMQMRAHTNTLAHTRISMRALPLTLSHKHACTHSA